jgi:hypothetical protein
MTVSYYEDDDTEIFYACLGEMALDGLLRIKAPVTAQSAWEWIPRQSDNWDSVHQKIYRNFRATELGVTEVASLPPLPDPSTKPAWHPVVKEFLCAEYPDLTRCLRENEPHRAEFFAVLGEDTYETSLGDGEFHYFEYLGRTERDAQEYIAAAAAAPDTGYSRYHVRYLHLILDGDSIRYDLQVELFDRCNVPKILEAANSLAAKNAPHE